MGRKKKNDSSTLVCLIDEFYLAKEGDVSCLTAAELERYAQAKGLTVKAYDIRRDAMAVKRINDLKAQQKMESGSPVVAAYKSLDVNQLIQSARDINDLKAKILDLDGYWRRIEERNSYLEAQLSKTESQKDASQKREEERLMKVESLLAENGELSVRLRLLNRENAALRHLFKKHIYPAVALEILQEKGVLKDSERTVTIPVKAFASFVAPERPEPFPGAQGTAPEKVMSKEEKLMEQLRKAVFDEDED